jgi:integrase
MGYTRFRYGRHYIIWNDVNGRRHEDATTARTRAEARGLLAEKESQVNRQRLGLEAAPTHSSVTLRDACEWWLKRQCAPDAVDDERATLAKHVYSAADLADVPLQTLRAQHFEDLFDELEGEDYAAGTINRLRNILHAAIDSLPETTWPGRNPLDKVSARTVTKRVYALLKPHEIDVLLPRVPALWRGEVATAIYAALRKGEILGLLKKNVDLDARLITVANSYAKDTTKGNHADVVPMADDLWPLLHYAIKVRPRPGPWVFPKPDGTMRTREADPHLVLRRALGRAGIVDGYTHVCRRCKGRGLPPEECEQFHPDAERRRCARCDMALWPVPQPRPIRFHDLRHSTATALLAKGYQPHQVQKVLRHASVQTTVNLYGHLHAEDVRALVNDLTPSGPASPPKPPKQAGGQRGPKLVEGIGPAGAPNSSEDPAGSGWALQGSNLRPPPCEGSPGGHHDDPGIANPSPPLASGGKL